MEKRFVLKNIEGETCITDLEAAVDLLREKLTKLPGGYYMVKVDIERMLTIIDQESKMFMEKKKSLGICASCERSWIRFEDNDIVEYCAVTAEVLRCESPAYSRKACPDYKRVRIKVDK